MRPRRCLVAASNSFIHKTYNTIGPGPFGLFYYFCCCLLFYLLVIFLFFARGLCTQWRSVKMEHATVPTRQTYKLSVVLRMVTAEQRNVAITFNCNIKCYSLLNSLGCLTKTTNKKNVQNNTNFSCWCKRAKRQQPHRLQMCTRNTNRFDVAGLMGNAPARLLDYMKLIGAADNNDRSDMAIRNRSTHKHTTNKWQMANVCFRQFRFGWSKDEKTQPENWRPKLMITQMMANGCEWRTRACAIVYNQSLTERYGAAGKLTKVRTSCRSRTVSAVHRCATGMVLCIFISLFILRSHSRSLASQQMRLGRWEQPATGTPA